MASFKVWSLRFVAADRIQPWPRGVLERGQQGAFSNFRTSLLLGNFEILFYPVDLFTQPTTSRRNVPALHQCELDSLLPISLLTFCRGMKISKLLWYVGMYHVTSHVINALWLSKQPTSFSLSLYLVSPHQTIRQ